MDHRRLARLVDFAPQPAHVHVDEIAARHEFVVPDLLEQHGAGEQLVFAAHHVFEQTKFPRQQLDGALAAPGRAPEEIEFQRTDAQDGILAFRRPAQQRLDTGDKLDDRERLGEIIVAARAQPAHPVVDRAERAEYQHGSAHAFLPHHFNDGEAVDPGKQAVDDHGVGFAGTRLVEPFYSRCRPIDVEPALDEFGHDFPGGFRVVLDQQHFRHGKVRGEAETTGALCGVRRRHAEDVRLARTGTGYLWHDYTMLASDCL